MEQPLQVIHVEDSTGDCELVESLLLNGGLNCQIKRIEDRDGFIEALQQSPLHLILSDCTLPQFHGLDALKIARALRPEIPFIFISGTIGEETAVESLQQGATDYVLKQGLARLIPAVRRALAEAETRKARAALEGHLRQARKLETLGTLLGGIAHDLRNLLQILKLKLDLLPMVADEPEQVRRLAAELNQTTDRGTDMMAELLVFARKTDARFEMVDLAARLRESANYLKPSLPENITLTLQLANGLPEILADVSQLERIVANLVGNARDAMPDGGDITLALDLARFDPVSAASWNAKETPYARIRVADTGAGMTPEVQARVFEPFFTTKPMGKGTGLGLSVVFGLMESHQGFIDLDSKPGVGTVFSLFFPLPEGSDVPPDMVELVTPTRLLGGTAGAGAKVEEITPAADI